VAEAYEALTVKEKMRQMVNSEDVAGSSGKALYVCGRGKIQNRIYHGKFCFRGKNHTEKYVISEV
jgi:hypothetical protein